MNEKPPIPPLRWVTRVVPSGVHWATEERVLQVMWEGQWVDIPEVEDEG